MDKSNLAEIDSKRNISFLLVSLALILLNFEVISLDEIIQKFFNVKIEGALTARILLWLVWAYLLLQFIHTYKLSEQNLLQKITKEFKRRLAEYSRKKRARFIYTSVFSDFKVKA